jgi:hypothetical protein
MRKPRLWLLISFIRNYWKVKIQLKIGLYGDIYLRIIIIYWHKKGIMNKLYTGSV